MKRFALLAGVAALSVMATSASAQNMMNRGQYVNGGSGQIVGTYNQTGFLKAAQGHTLTSADDVNFAKINNQSVWLAIGSAEGNNGTAAGNDGATFTLKGNVTKDCSFYSGSSTNQTLDFGTLGIYASDNTGPAAAFDMVAPANVTVYTNLAGCNTANSVTITKNSADGLINSGNTGGYDSNVFQANLPFSVEAKYTAAAHNSVANGSQQTLSVSSTALSNVANHGAWKSPFSLAVNIPVASKALLAGNYEGTVAVQIQAF